MISSCLYCGAESNTVEHVPPRSFLEKPFPNNLVTVDACLSCNQGFSKDEEYAIALLAQIGTSEYLQAKIEPNGVIDRAFSRSPGFEQRFIDRLKTDENGRVYIEPELDRLEKILIKIVCGLFWLQYKRVARPAVLGPIGFWPFNIEDSRPVKAFLPAFNERFTLKRWTIVQDAVFEYMFAKLVNGQHCCIINWHRTLWITCIVPSPLSCPSHTGQHEINLTDAK
jgi:hypothetical protein